MANNALLGGDAAGSLGLSAASSGVGMLHERPPPPALWGSLRRHPVWGCSMSGRRRRLFGALCGVIRSEDAPWPLKAPALWGSLRRHPV